MSMSEGETQRINLACYFALSDLMQEATGMALQLNVLDEPLTGIDAEGKEKVFAIIKQRCKQNQIIVIDHDEHFKSQFHDLITVKKNSGESRVEVA